MLVEWSVSNGSSAERMADSDNGQAAVKKKLKETGGRYQNNQQHRLRHTVSTAAIVTTVAISSNSTDGAFHLFVSANYFPL